MDTAGDLNERHKWGENIKVYTRRIKNRKHENITSLNSDITVTVKINDDKNINTLPDQFIHTLATQDLKQVWEGCNKTIADQSLQIEATEDLNAIEEDNDTIHDKSLQIIATEGLNLVLEDEIDTVQDQSLKILATEELKSIQEDDNNKIHGSMLEIVATEVSENLINNVTSDSDVTTEEKKDDKGHGSDREDDESKNKNTDTVPDKPIHTLAARDCNSVLKDNDVVAEQGLQMEATDSLNPVQEKDNDAINYQSLQITATEDMNSVQEDESDTLCDKSLQNTATKDFNSVQEDCNDATHDQSSEVVAAEELNLVEEDANDTVVDEPLQIMVTEREQENDLLSDQDQPQQVAVENGYERININDSVKPIITKVDGRVRIYLAPARPTNEIRGLKRKLEDELDQVRSLVRRLESKKIQLSSYSAGNGVYRALTRVNSVVGSVDHYNSRPFHHLSVQVLENDHDFNDFGDKDKRTPKENQYYRSSDFLLAKDRLPLADGNKKLKTNGMRRHSGELGYGYVMNKHTVQALKSCNNLLARLMRHKFAWVFNKPVDAKALGLHDYHYIIRNPMDLGTIKSRLARNFYKFPREFAEDVRLTFRNAMTYNPKGQDVHVMAEQLSNIFEDKWAAIESEYNYDLRYGFVQDTGLPTPSPRKVHPPPPPSLSIPPLSRPPALDMRVLERTESMTMPMDYYRLKPNTPVGRTPVPKKPKAKDLNKRDMTYDEKQRLSTHLQNLPSDKLDALVQIIKKGSSSLSQHDDEIEVDIDSVDTETLWELDRFVTNYKKNLSKKKRRAELAKARAEARPAVSATNHAPAVTQTAPKTFIKDPNNVATFPLPGERLGESSSSGSSSGDSDSDSSDSDSDSSSGSDAGHSPNS